MIVRKSVATGLLTLLCSLCLSAAESTSSTTSAQPTGAVLGTSDGCGKDPGLEPGFENRKRLRMKSSGGGRSYLLHVPKNYDQNKKNPLIFSFHGKGRNALYQQVASNMSNSDWNPDHIVVYPQGLQNSWQGAPYHPTSISDDAYFVRDLLVRLETQYCIDPTRVYATGESNGGGFTATLACLPRVSGLFAAYAPVIAAIYDDMSYDSGCKPANPKTPMVEFHGSEDKLVPYEGRKWGSPTTNIPNWLSWWARRNGCAEGEGKTNSWETDYKVNHTSYDCDGNEGVVQGYWIKGMGHDWPSTYRNIDSVLNHHTPAAISATPLIMKFFRRYSL